MRLGTLAPIVVALLLLADPARALARQFERIIDEIFDAVVEEARVKGR